MKLKTFASFFVFLSMAVSGFSQNGIYLFGYMDNAPQDPVTVEATIYSNPPVTVYLETNPSGSIPTQWVDLPSETWYGIQTSFLDCTGSDATLFFPDTIFPNNIDIPLFLIYCSDSVNVVYGCTDPTAINFDPAASVDNGSCVYDSVVVANDLCADALPLSPGTILIDNTFANQNEGIWGECWGFGAGEGEQTSIWYSFTTPNVPASIHLETSYDGSNTLTDTQFGIFKTCGGDMIYCDGNSGQNLMSALDFECGELEVNTTYLLMIDGWNGDAGTCYLTYSVDTTCAPAVYGCTDPEALNYNPEATDDNGSCEYAPEPCEANALTLVITTNIWAGEISWQLLNNGSIMQGGAGYQNNSEYTINWCLEDGCYDLRLLDSSGDGWNGSTYTIQFGDDVLASGTLATGNSGLVTFGVNQEGCQPVIPGCTDPTAYNYNPDATVDDGSCLYEAGCTQVLIQLDGSSTNTGNWGIYEGDSVIVSGAYSGSDQSFEACLVDGCYSLEFDFTSDPSTSSAVVYTIISLDSSLYMAGIFNQSPGMDTVNFQIGGGCNTDVYGCTDPTAFNYNPDATIDDGSCSYWSPNCVIGFFISPDTLQDVIWILPGDSINYATEVLWDFGDGTTSNELFPQHTYEDEGPYVLCLTVWFDLPNFECSDTYCAEVSGTLINGSGFGPTSFTINVVNGEIPTSVNTPDVDSAKLHLFPNPANDNLSIEFDGTMKGKYAMTIYNIIGEAVYTNSTSINSKNTIKIDVSNLQSGGYILNIENDKTIQTARFVKTK